MSKVYIPQIPSRFDPATQLWIPMMDVKPAKRFGEIVIMFEQRNSRAEFHSIVGALRDKLKTYEPHDYLVAIGDPAIIAAAALIIGDRCGGHLRLLKWDRNERDYNVTEIDIHD